MFGPSADAALPSQFPYYRLNPFGYQRWTIGSGDVFSLPNGHGAGLTIDQGEMFAALGFDQSVLPELRVINAMLPAGGGATNPMGAGSIPYSGLNITQYGFGFAQMAFRGAIGDGLTGWIIISGNNNGFQQAVTYYSAILAAFSPQPSSVFTLTSGGFDASNSLAACPDIPGGSNYVIGRRFNDSLYLQWFKFRWSFFGSFEERTVDLSFDSDPLLNQPSVAVKACSRGFLFIAGTQLYAMDRVGMNYWRVNFQYPDGSDPAAFSWGAPILDEYGIWYQQQIVSKRIYTSYTTNLRLVINLPQPYARPLVPIALPCLSPCIGANVTATQLLG